MNMFKRTLPLLPAFLTAVIYLGFRTKNYYWDGVEFATIIENTPALSPSLFHPNHLIYNVFGWLIYQSFNSFGWQIRALDVLQIVNCILGGLCAYVLFHILKTAFRSDYLAAVFTALFAFSATWWKFATDANAYTPSVLFLLIAFYFLLPGQKPRPLLIALLHCFAMFFHQLAIFFYPVAALGIYMQTSSPSIRKRSLSVLQYSVVTALLTAISFCAAFYFSTGRFDLAAFRRWLTNYSPEVGFVFNAWSNLGYTLRGHARLFFDGRFNFAKLGVNAVDTVLFVALIILFLALLFQLVRNAKDFKTLPKRIWEGLAHHQALALLCVVWAVAYLIFLFFFIPQNTFYRLFYLPALIILAAIPFAEIKEVENRKWRLALFAAVVALANFLFFIQPYSRVRDETPLLLALQLNQKWSPQTVVYYALPSTDNTLIKYYNPATSWKKLDAADLEKLTVEIQEIYANGGEVWLDTTASDTIKRSPNGADWLTKHSVADAQYKLRDPAYNLSFVKVIP